MVGCHPAVTAADGCRETATTAETAPTGRQPFSLPCLIQNGLAPVVLPDECLVTALEQL